MRRNSLKSGGDRSGCPLEHGLLEHFAAKGKPGSPLENATLRQVTAAGHASARPGKAQFTPDGARTDDITQETRRRKLEDERAQGGPFGSPGDGRGRWSDSRRRSGDLPASDTG
jgi:hypothetical protein